MDRTAFYELSKIEQTRARGVSLSHFLAKTHPDRFFIDEKGYGRDRENPKFKIDNHRNYYYFNDIRPHATGNSIDYLMYHMGMTHPQAVRTLLAYDDEYPFG